jgi:hypothetical protein
LLHEEHGGATVLIERAAVNAGTDATTKRQDGMHVRSAVRGVVAAVAWWYIRQQQPFDNRLQQCDLVAAAKVQQRMYWSLSESWFNIGNSVRSKVFTVQIAGERHTLESICMLLQVRAVDADGHWLPIRAVAGQGGICYTQPATAAAAAAAVFAMATQGQPADCLWLTSNAM